MEIQKALEAEGLTELIITAGGAHPNRFEHFQTNFISQSASPERGDSNPSAPEMAEQDETPQLCDRVGVWIFVALTAVVSAFAGYRFWTKIAFPFPE